MNGFRPSGSAEELDRLSDELTREKMELQEDNKRLRALLKAAEWSDGHQGYSGCPWCESVKNFNWGGVSAGEHYDTCPAFKPSGEVR